MTGQRNSPARRSPLVALILGLIPGFGQLYSGVRGRGLAVLFLVPALVLLTIWRMLLGGVNYEGPAAAAPSEAQVRAAWGMGIVLFTLVLLIYLWSIWDGVRAARRRPLALRPMVLLSTFAFFIIGWDVTEIDLQKAMTRLGEIGPRLGQLAWPWDNAFVRGVERIQASAEIGVPCGSGTPAVAEEVIGAPFIEVSPNCGEMAGPVQPDGTRNPPGTILNIKGRGFRPNLLISVWWVPPVTGEFRPRIAGNYIVIDAGETGAFELQMPIPNFTIPGGTSDPEASNISRLVLRQEQEQGSLRPSTNLLLALEKMIETIFLGLMATLFGIILALPFGFLAARNIMSGSWRTMSIYASVRLVLNITRSIEPLIWAVVAVVWVGLGPFAGTVALSLHTIASLGKLYSEAIENIDPGPVEAVQATGANWIQVILYAVIPQVIPPFVSFTIYRWDVNIRSSTIIGAVGGGGIGFLLIQWIRLSDYDSAGIAVWLIAIVVSALDYISAQIRKRFV